MALTDAYYTTVKGWAWQCQECARECVPIRAESRCLCGHRLKEHADGHKCSNRACSCPQFSFIVAEGSWVLRCRCKHKHTEHDPASHTCRRAACNCTGFNSSWVCNCDHPWSQHQQIMVERQVIRVAGMIAQAQQSSADDQEAEDTTAAAAPPPPGIERAVPPSTSAAEEREGDGDSVLSHSAARSKQLQSLRELQQQRQNQHATQQGGQHAAAVAAGDEGMLAHAHDAAAADTSFVLLAEGHLTCEVNRWDLLQRGKE